MQNHLTSSISLAAIYNTCILTRYFYSRLHWFIVNWCERVDQLSCGEFRK